MVPDGDLPTSLEAATRVCCRPADCPYAGRRGYRAATWLRRRLVELLPGDPVLAAEIAALLVVSAVTNRCTRQAHDGCGGDEEAHHRRPSAANAPPASDYSRS